MSGRSMRSCLSTSIRRRPRSAYSLSRALISDDLPVPRAPQQHVVAGFSGQKLPNVQIQGRLCRSIRCKVGQPQAVRMPDRPQAAALAESPPAECPVGFPVRCRRRRQALLQPFQRGRQPFGQPVRATASPTAWTLAAHDHGALCVRRAGQARPDRRRSARFRPGPHPESRCPYRPGSRRPP